MRETQTDRIIRASEIGEYVYCHRAWWLHHVQGVASANRAEMQAGVTRHLHHGRAVQRAVLWTRAAIAFGAGAVILVMIALAIG